MAATILGPGPRGVIETVELDSVQSETHIRHSEGTEHPVETGADIVDHVHTKPKSVTLKGQISELVQQAKGGFDLDRIALARDTLERYRTEGTLVTIITGFDTYERMQIRDLEFERSPETGRSLVVSIGAKESRTVSTLRVAAKRPGGQEDNGFISNFKADPAKSADVLRRASLKIGSWFGN